MRRTCGLVTQLCRAAYRSSHFNGGDALRGIFAVDATDLTGRPVYLARDECVRKTSLDVLAKLPGFTPNGLVSPGNASEISDGAAAQIVVDRAEAEKQGLPTRYEIVSYGVVGVEPRVMGRGPVPSIQQALLAPASSRKTSGFGRSMKPSPPSISVSRRNSSWTARLRTLTAAPSLSAIRWRPPEGDS